MTPACLPAPSVAGDTGRRVMRACVGPRIWTLSTVTTGGLLTTTRAKSVPAVGPLTVAMTVRTGGGSDAACATEKPMLAGETTKFCPPVPPVLSVPSPLPWQPAMAQAISAAQPARPARPARPNAAADIRAIASSREPTIVAEYIDGP